MIKKLTTEEFIKRSLEKHNGIYDYSQSVYVNSRAKIFIICKIHGLFQQQARCHLAGKGCLKCACSKKSKKAVRKSKTIDEFIIKAQSIHGDKYDYSQAVYKNYRTILKIICPIHGIFYQTAANHLRCGCKKCGKQRLAKSLNKFILNAKSVHGDKYDYSNTTYINSKAKLNITCHKHGMFQVVAYYHLKGKGCEHCKKEIESLAKIKKITSKTSKKKTLERFIEESQSIYGNQYDYSQTNYVSFKKELNIICPTHGMFKVTPQRHLCKPQGCYGCKVNERFKDFIKQANNVHDNKYDYSQSKYINQKTKIIIRCPIHGDFLQTPDGHLQKRGCSKCRKSTGEIAINRYLTENKINFDFQFQLPYGGRLDFLLHYKKIAIEYNGIQHYIPTAFSRFKPTIDDFLTTIARDRKKRMWCQENNIKLFVIPFWEKPNINQLIKNCLCNCPIKLNPPPEEILNYIKEYRNDLYNLEIQL